MKLITCLVILGFIAGLSSAQAANRTITVFANAIDYESVKSTLDLYKIAGIGVDYVVGSGYAKRVNDPLIFVVGGHNSPSGTGDIVSGILTPPEKDYLTSKPDARRVFVVPGLWNQNQTVFVFAGYSKEQTRRMVSEAFPDILRSLTLKDTGGLENYTSERAGIPPVDETQPYTEVDAYQAKALIDGVQGIVVFDVRASPYYDAGHIPGAKNMPARKAELALPSLERDKTYLLYCGGNSESIFVGNEMAAMGYKKVYRLVDGYVAWRKAGYPRDRVLQAG